MNFSDVRPIRGAATATTVLAPVATVVAALTAGGPGAAAAALAVAVVAAFFAATAATLGRVPSDVLLPAAMAFYFAKIIALGVLLIVLRRVDFLNHAVFGWCAFATAVVWLGTQVGIFRRVKMVYVVPVSSAPAGR